MEDSRLVKSHNYWSVRGEYGERERERERGRERDIYTYSGGDKETLVTFVVDYCSGITTGLLIISLMFGYVEKWRPRRTCFRLTSFGFLNQKEKKNAGCIPRLYVVSRDQSGRKKFNGRHARSFLWFDEHHGMSRPKILLKNTCKLVKNVSWGGMMMWIGCMSREIS
jgi:hypothetical protein